MTRYDESRQAEGRQGWAEGEVKEVVVVVEHWGHDKSSRTRLSPRLSEMHVVVVVNCQEAGCRRNSQKLFPHTPFDHDHISLVGRMPAISPSWMESNKWQQDPLDWASHAYHLLAPRVNVRGRMALVLLVAVIWAFSWLLWRAYSVIQTPNDILVDKLGLDIPPAPIVTLEEISSREIQITWKPSEVSTSVHEHYIEVNGRIAGTARKNETAATISNLLPGNAYDIRIFSVSTGRFQTPSLPLHVRTPNDSQASSQDEHDVLPTVRAIVARTPQNVTPILAPAMIREPSGGQTVGRRGTGVRRPSPANHNTGSETDFGKGTDDELDGNLVELSQRFQKVQQDIEIAEAQIQEEDKEFDTQLKELDVRRDKLRQDLKKRDEESSDLRKQVHKAETQNRALLSDKTKKERELQAKENERQKKKDEIAKWEEQISTMAEEMAGIDTQKAAIQRRTQSDIREVRRKIEEEQKEVARLEEENKDRAFEIKSLEEERKQLNAEDETDETREADRLEYEKEMRWRQRFADLNATYSRIWNDLQQAHQHYSIARDRLALYENVRRNTSVSFAPVAPLDMEAVRRGMKPIRRPRHTGSHGSSVSSPRGPFPPEIYSTANYNPASNASPTTFGPSFFNPQNGMTLMMPTELPITTIEDVEPISSMPMSPRADALLPADLLGDESGDDNDEMGVKPTVPESNMLPFPKIGSPSFREDAQGSPSGGSSSGRSFSSPREMFAEADQKSMHSAQQSIEQASVNEPEQTNSRKLMANLFSFNRQRGKTLADQGPVLGSLKSGQSQSYPRNLDEFDPSAQPRRRLSYGGNWAFPGGLLQRNVDKDQVPRFSSSRRAFPSLIPSFTKSSNAGYDPFAARTNSIEPSLRGDSNSPRPSSTYSFDKLPRPSMESQFHAWNVDKPAMRNSPLAPDWGSLHSFSRSHSRRPSIGYGSTSNLSLQQGDEEVVERREPARPLQAPIGTRPASSQRPSTPKLNPAAPSFTMLFGKRGEKVSKGKKSNEIEMSPPEPRKSKDTHSIAATTSTFESRESLDRTASGTSAGTPAGTPAENTPVKPTFISRISRKASSNKFGSWKDKGGIFSRKETSTPTGEADDEHGSTEHLGRSLESTSTTPSGEDKKASRPSLGSWNFMRKPKRGVKDDLTASEVSESSERTSETGDDRYDEDG